MKKLIFAAILAVGCSKDTIDICQPFLRATIVHEIYEHHPREAGSIDTLHVNLPYLGVFGARAEVGDKYERSAYWHYEIIGIERGCE